MHIESFLICATRLLFDDLLQYDLRFFGLFLSQRFMYSFRFAGSVCGMGGSGNAHLSPVSQSDNPVLRVYFGHQGVAGPATINDAATTDIGTASDLSLIHI